MATKFEHLYYVPLLPTGSYIVFGAGGETFEGVRLGFNFKSIFVAWARAAMVVLVVGLLFGACWYLGGHQRSTSDGVICLLAAVFVGITLWQSYRIKGIAIASESRAMELAKKAQLNELGMIELGVALGKMTREQANDAIAKISAARADGAKVVVGSPLTEADAEVRVG